MDEDEVRAAKDALSAESKRYRRAAATVEESGKAAIALALKLLRANVAPSEVARLSPFTDSYIRKAARDAGIPAARPARGVTAKRLSD